MIDIKNEDCIQCFYCGTLVNKRKSKRAYPYWYMNEQEQLPRYLEGEQYPIEIRYMCSSCFKSHGEYTIYIYDNDGYKYYRVKEVIVQESN